MAVQLQARSQGFLKEKAWETRMEPVLSSVKGHHELLEIPHFSLMDPGTKLANRKEDLSFLTEARQGSNRIFQLE
jgi:hypothetical protein